MIEKTRRNLSFKGGENKMSYFVKKIESDIITRADCGTCGSSLRIVRHENEETEEREYTMTCTNSSCGRTYRKYERGNRLMKKDEDEQAELTRKYTEEMKKALGIR